MTNDFKKKILDWLSGNYSVGTGVNVPTFSESDSYFNDLKNKIDNLFPYNNYIDGSLQAYDVSGNGLKYTIVYGEYDPTSSSTLEQRRGFILILDDDFDLVQSITQYSSGTYFGVFEILGVGDDGNFFAIERLSNGTKRFVMMNNIIAKLPTETSYKVMLKKSYTLQGACANLDVYGMLIKSPGQSKYLIVGTDYNTTTATELVVNVGMSNEWNDYIYNHEDFSPLGDIYANWTANGNLTFKIAGFKSNIEAEIPTFNYAELSGSSSNVGTLSITTYGSSLANYEYLFQYDVKIINSNESYFSITYSTEQDYGIYAYEDLYHFNNGNITKIYSKKSNMSPECNIVLDRIDNEIFYLAQYTTGSPGSDTYHLETGRIIGDSVYSKEMLTSNDAIEYMFFAVQKQFDLYNYYIQIGTNVEKTSQIYNPNEYNGAPYQALNSMIPDRAELISEQVVIFARSLYNKIINNNTTTSIVNVPNNYVNDVVIDAQNLYGETKSLLVNNNQNIETNIYEELMINFVNTLLMRNENNINNIIDNLAGAIRLNKSISSLLDYDNCKITKYKINYNDNTSTIFNFPISNINYLANKTIYTISFYNENVEDIQIISNDESTIYQTIDISNLEIGKYYLITQDLHIV